MRRYWHWLRENRRSRRPECVIFFDVESNIECDGRGTETHTFRLGVACVATYSEDRGLEAEDWITFLDLRVFWAWVEAVFEHHEEIWLVAHNIDYDSRVSDSFHFVPLFGWTPTYCVFSRHCTFVKWERGDQALTMLDNLNLWRCTLAELGETVGLPKGEIDFDTVGTAELAAYCRRDVEILVEAWRQHLDLLDREDLGDWGITISGQAFNAYRHRFMSEQIGIHPWRHVIELERRAYRGGRNECFYIGELTKGPYYKLDVNSLYPAMMRYCDYPAKVEHFAYHLTPASLENYIDRSLVIAEVALEIKTPRYPYQIDGRNIYPTGSIETVLTTPEIRSALRAGEIVGVGMAALYTPADLFSEYVDFFYALKTQAKQAGDSALYAQAKNYLNSLYGKFGQRGYRQKQVGEAPLDVTRSRIIWQPEAGRTVHEWTFGGKIIDEWQEGEAENSFPAIPAHVTAYGRMQMHVLIEQAGRRNVFYVDTDSLIVNGAGFRCLQAWIDPLELGMLKVEGKADYVEIRAKKDYTFGNEVVIKGIRADAEKVREGTYRQRIFTSLRGGFLERDLSHVTVRQATKTLERKLAHGHVRRDGYVNPPHVEVDLGALVTRAQNEDTRNRWHWEFDPRWLQERARSGSLRRRLMASLRWEGSPELPPQPLEPAPVPF